MFVQYSSPLVIAASLALLIYFSKLNIFSATINWIASSCFAVYLFHFMIFPNVITPVIVEVKNHNADVMAAIMILCILIVFFFSAVLLDRIRLLMWKLFQKNIKFLSER